MDQEVYLTIDLFCPRGFGMTHFNNGKIEVAHTIPGDQIRAQVRRKSHRIKKGRLLEVVHPSPDRVSPRCLHATICGGCCWQSMDYSAQLRHKQESIRKAFGELFSDSVTIHPIVPAETPWHYRNKMEFSFSENRAGTRFLGLMIAHAEPYVFSLEECHIAPKWMAECLGRIRSWWEQSQLPAYYPPDDRGLLRYVTMRETTRTGQRMVILNVSGRKEWTLPIESFIQAIGSESTSVYLRVHQLQKGVPTHFEETHLSGPRTMIERMDLIDRSLLFSISPSSFFQPNTLQAEKLYNCVSSWIAPESRFICDLYCGTGTLGMIAAIEGRKVIGIDLNADAIADAKENAKQNQLENVHFYAGEASEVIANLIQNGSQKFLDTLIVDPPRAGLDERMLREIDRLQARQLIYVSCNPLTQAENIRRLVSSGYQLIAMQAFDQFPHTAHVENVANLYRK